MDFKNPLNLKNLLEKQHCMTFVRYLNIFTCYGCIFLYGYLYKCNLS